MAAAFRAQATAGNGQATAVSSLAITIPSSSVVGDVAVLSVQTTSTTATLTTPTGWTLRSGPDASASQSWLFTNTISAGEPGAVTTLTVSSATRIAATMVVVSGVTETGLSLAAQVETANTQDPVLPSLTSVPAGSGVVAFLDRRTGYSPPTSMRLPAEFTAGTNVKTAYGASPELTLLAGWLFPASSGAQGGDSAHVNGGSVGVNYLLALPATVSNTRTATGSAGVTGTASATAGSATATAVGTAGVSGTATVGPADPYAANTPADDVLDSYLFTYKDGSIETVDGVGLLAVNGANYELHADPLAGDDPFRTIPVAQVTAIAKATPTGPDPVVIVNAAQANAVSGSSTTYQQATSGWLLGTDGTASYQHMQVVGDLTGNSASVTSLAVQGRDFLDYLNDRPLGLVAQGFESTLSLQGVTAEKGIAEISFPATPGRGYRVTVDGPEYGASDAATLPNFKMRYTIDGTAPTVASTLVRDFDGENPQTGVGRIFRGSFLWYPGIAIPHTIRLLLTFARATGTGTVGVAPVNNRLQMWVEDVGPTLPNSIVINGSQTSSPPPAPSAAPIAGQATFYTTWGASYRADGSRWSENSSGWAYQGYGDSYNGDQMSLHGFDGASIRSQLAGATITSATFYALNGWTWGAAGGYCLLGSHQSVSMPASAPGGVTMRRATASVSRGGWVKMDCTGLFNEILANTTQGVVLGRAGTSDPTFYAKWFQAPDPNRPRIVVNYSK